MVEQRVGKTRFSTTFAEYPPAVPKPTNGKIKSKNGNPPVQLKRRERGQAPVIINSEEDLTYITFRNEREFARLLLEHNPNLKITYEPGTFSYTENEKTEETLPDFKIVNMITGREFFVEITTGYLNGSDPKAKQKRIMNGLGLPYVVLYGHNLSKIQKVHPDYKCFKEDDVGV